jgi:hypothetical protein
MCAGYSAAVVSSRDWWRSWFWACLAAEIEQPAVKVFKPKFPNLPVLSSYKEINSDDFWAKFPVNRKQPAVSNISAAVLRGLLAEYGLLEGGDAVKVLDWLENGAKIGAGESE